MTTLNEQRIQLLRTAHLVLAFWGWAMLAVAASTLPFVILVAGAGFLAAVVTWRAPLATVIVEGLALAGCAAAVVVVVPERAGFVVLGAVLVVAARAVVEVARRRAD